jgi:hypothetical protein
MLLSSFGQERRRLRRQYRLARNGEDAEIELGIDQPARLVGGYINTELLEQSQDRTRLDGARRVVVSGDENDGCIG